MELTICIQILIGLALLALLVGDMILCMFLLANEKKILGFVSCFIIAFGIGQLGKIFDGADVIVVYPDRKPKRSTWMKYFQDSSGQRYYDIEKRATYVFYDTGHDVFDKCEVSVYPIYYSTKTQLIGKKVKGYYDLVENLSLAPSCLHRLEHTIHYPFREVPLKKVTGDPSSLEVIWTIDYTSKLAPNYAPEYRTLVYEPPETSY